MSYGNTELIKTECQADKPLPLLRGDIHQDSCLRVGVEDQTPSNPGVSPEAQRAQGRQTAHGKRQLEKEGSGSNPQTSEINNVQKGPSLRWTKWLSCNMFMGSWTIKPANLQMSS